MFLEVYKILKYLKVTCLVIFLFYFKDCCWTFKVKEYVSTERKILSGM